MGIFKFVTRLLCIAIGFLPFVAQAQDQQQNVEKIAHPDNVGFIVGHQASNAVQSIEEWVPKGETVHNWTQMITYQRLGSMKERGETPFSFANRLAGGMIGSCPGAIASPIEMPATDGVSIAQFSTLCPLFSSTGKPETTFFKLMAGKTDIHVAQVAYRRRASDKQTQWVKDYLSQVMLCTPDEKSSACQN